MAEFILALVLLTESTATAMVTAHTCLTSVLDWVTALWINTALARLAIVLSKAMTLVLAEASNNDNICSLWWKHSLTLRLHLHLHLHLLLHLELLSLGWIHHHCLVGSLIHHTWLLHTWLLKTSLELLSTRRHHGWLHLLVVSHLWWLVLCDLALSDLVLSQETLAQLFFLVLVHPEACSAQFKLFQCKSNIILNLTPNH